MGAIAGMARSYPELLRMDRPSPWPWLRAPLRGRGGRPEQDSAMASAGTISPLSPWERVGVRGCSGAHISSP